MDKAFKAFTMCLSKMFHLCPYEPMNHICLCMFAPGRDGVSSADGMMHEQNSASSASTQRRSFPSREPRDAAPVVHNSDNSHNTQTWRQETFHLSRRRSSAENTRHQHNGQKYHSAVTQLLAVGRCRKEEVSPSFSPPVV